MPYVFALVSRFTQLTHSLTVMSRWGIISFSDGAQGQLLSDSQLATFLQENDEEEDTSDSDAFTSVKVTYKEGCIVSCFEVNNSSLEQLQKTLTFAQKLQLNKLLEEFSGCDQQSVQRIFEDNRLVGAYGGVGGEGI